MKKSKNVTLDNAINNAFLNWIKLKDINKKDKSTFSEVINAVTERRIMKISNIRQMFGVNYATIHRWKKGTNCPSSAFYRVNIINAIEQMVEDNVIR